MLLCATIVCGWAAEYGRFRPADITATSSQFVGADAGVRTSTWAAGSPWASTGGIYVDRKEPPAAAKSLTEPKIE